MDSVYVTVQGPEVWQVAIKVKVSLSETQTYAEVARELHKELAYEWDVKPSLCKWAVFLSYKDNNPVCRNENWA